MPSAEPQAPESRKPATEAGFHSDKELAAAVLRKDRKATAEWVSLHADSVYNYVRRRLVPRADLVDDVVQEVFLAAWESLDQFEGNSSLCNWLLGIARHKVEDYYRRCLRQAEMPLEEDYSASAPAGPQSLDEVLDRQRAEEKTQQILSQLAEPYSLILLWRYWEKRSLREIAGQTGRTEKAVERLLARAREQFKKKWNE
jgi:RNA polymerase sigma-70 factor, ECF subfamily